MLLDRDLVFFGGKGGVGKTTCSAAFALGASRHGKRVLLVSTDPAHSTSDIFERQIGATPRELLPNLFAIEIDAGKEAARYVARVKEDTARMFSAAVVRQAHRQIDMAAASPGLAEVALLDRMIDLIVEEQGHDLIVFDTAPMGHTLQLLRMPEAMSTWVQALLRHRRAIVEIDQGAEGQQPAAVTDEDPVVAALERRHRRLASLRGHVTNRGRTAFVMVTIAERLAIEETGRAVEALVETGVDVAALVVNRLLPEGLTGDFYVSRKAQEHAYLGEIAQRFRRLPRIDVRQLGRDVYGLESLTAISVELSRLLR